MGDNHGWGHGGHHMADLSENREIYVLHLYLMPCRREPCQNFAKLFCTGTGKTRMSVLSYAEDSMMIY